MASDSISKYQKQLDQSRQFWDTEAAAFDQQPDHGLSEPPVYAAWTNLLSAVLPTKHGELLDLGCGTGSLSVLLAGLGFTLTGIDFSPDMIALANAKARTAGRPIQFHVMDAAFPQFPPQQFDVVLCRHVLWALSNPDQVLQRWIQLLKPGGRLILIEGYWHTGAGMHAQQIIDVLPASLTNVSVQMLSHQPDLWGHAVEDERYLIHADLPAGDSE
jgi:2-polyprenyl-3-methyl-5-hydroxy-6-metoxy-1,4-benzoquinol methylase